MLITFAMSLITLMSLPTLDDVPQLAGAAIRGDDTAVTKLRALGPKGLDALVTLRRGLDAVPPLFVGPVTAEVVAWEALVDKVARQKYASASGLYWYTDLDAAKAAARAQGKPILSLRLLGDLDEDLSCANSRFFRTVLYPDPMIAQALHDGWILHWQSVRKAPKIEVDFGDGRKLTRTITGNSLHYALAPDGTVLDVMPGMVGPQVFAAWLASAADFARTVQAAPAAERAAVITRHMRADLKATLTAWHDALRTLGLAVPRTADGMAALMTEDRLAALAADQTVFLSPEAMRLVGPMMASPGRAFNPALTAVRAMPIAISKMAIERPMLRVMSPVEGKLAQDQVRNTLEMKSRVLAIALDGDAYVAGDAGRDALTQEIYAKAFLTPLDDPWMGLAPDDVFTGLPREVEKTETAVR